MLVQLVRKEAQKLRKLSTREERERLDINTLNTTSSSYCIYGQMTGNCFSTRAHNLIMKCCERVYSVTTSHLSYLEGSKLNGKPYKVIGGSRKYEYFSPIEKYIYVRGADNVYVKRLVAYLKGEINELKIR